MQLFMSKFKKTVAAVQLSLLLLWVLFYPLHIVLSDSGFCQNSSYSASFKADACCCKTFSKAPDQRAGVVFKKFTLRPFCNICELANELASSALANLFSLSYTDDFRLSSIVDFSTNISAAFSFYYSRGPPC